MSVKAIAESTLTQRYQTTIPASIRKALNLSKNDKIGYTIDSDNRVIISRIETTEQDPILTNFLVFLEQDMQNSPQNIQPLRSDVINKAQSLVADVEIDLDAPLDEDE